MQKLDYSPNLVNYQQIVVSSDKYSYFVMEYCNGGPLSTVMKSLFVQRSYMPDDKIYQLLSQVCNGFQVLEKYNIIHLDIKPDNILIHNGNFKISDFGFAKEAVEETQNQVCGTRQYLAPEYLNTGKADSKVDVYSLGIVLYQLMYGYFSHPYFTK